MRNWSQASWQGYGWLLHTSICAGRVYINRRSPSHVTELLTVSERPHQVTMTHDPASAGESESGWPGRRRSLSETRQWACGCPAAASWQLADAWEKNPDGHGRHGTQASII